MSGVRRAASYLWAAPWTILGAALLPVTVLTGGIARIERGVLVLAGGAIRPLLRRLAPGRGIAAMTLGHTVLATDEASLHHTREHERVHVAQYERWGLLFPLLYGGASLGAWARGRHYYRDNWFEREARRQAPLFTSSLRTPSPTSAGHSAEWQPCTCRSATPTSASRGIR